MSEEHRWNNRRVGHLPILVALGLALIAMGWRIWPRRALPITDPTWARVQRTGVLRVGLDPSFPPFEYEENGSLVGYDVDLAQELGRRIGAQVQWVTVGFDGLYDGLRADKYDAIVSSLPYDPRLTKDVAYSWVTFNAGQRLVVREGEERIRGVEDLKGKRVAVEWGSAGDMEGRRLEERIGFERVLYLTPREALEALRDGEAEAAIVDGVSAYGFMGEEGGIMVVGLPVTDEPYVIAVRLDSPILLWEINAALRAMEEEGVLEGLRGKWFYSNTLTSTTSSNSTSFSPRLARFVTGTSSRRCRFSSAEIRSTEPSIGPTVAAITGPVASVWVSSNTPWPPRLCTGNSLSGTRLT